jgi:hypothetical protein
MKISPGFCPNLQDYLEKFQAFFNLKLLKLRLLTLFQGRLILTFWGACRSRRHRVLWYNLSTGKPAKRISPSPPGAGSVRKEGLA